MKIGNKIYIIILGKQIKINQNALIRWYFENTNYSQRLNWLILNKSKHFLVSHHWHYSRNGINVPNVSGGTLKHMGIIYVWFVGQFFFQLRNVALYKDLSTSWITHSKSRVKWTPFDKYYLSTFDTHRILLLMNVFSVNGIILTSDGLITARFKAKSMIHWCIIENPSKQHHILWMYGLIECTVHRLIKWVSPRRVMLSGGIR